MTFEEAILLWRKKPNAELRRRSWPSKDLRIKRGVYVDTDGGESNEFQAVADPIGLYYLVTGADVFALDWEEYKPEPPKPKTETEKVGNFQCALTCLKNGARVARQSWIDKYLARQSWLDKYHPLNYPGVVLRNSVFYYQHGIDEQYSWQPGNQELLAEDWVRILPN